MNEKVLKECKTCGVKKEATEDNFGLHARAADGLQPNCKECFPKVIASGKRRQRLNAKSNAGMVLNIDFSGHKDILDEVINIAEKELRTPENQILYLLTTLKS